MKCKFTRITILFAVLIIAVNVEAQRAGDYRSVQATAIPVSYEWTAVQNWQTYDGSGWVSATAFPTAADNRISISSGDSIRLTNLGGGPTSIDEVVVDAGGSFLIYNLLVSLNDSVGINDIIVNGLMTISTASGSATTQLSGPGSIEISSGGRFALRTVTGNTGPVLSVNTVNKGIFTIENNATIGGLTGGINVINQKTLRIVNNNVTRALAINNATLSNTDSLVIVDGGLRNVSSSSAGNLVNDGVIYHQLATGSFTTTLNQISFQNTGRIKGLGGYTFPLTGPQVNSGTIEPGNNGPGVLTFGGSSVVSNKTANLIFDFVTNGNGGVGFDSLSFATGSYNLTGTTIEIRDNVDAPLRSYVIMTTPGLGGTFSGTPTIVKPANFSDPVFLNTNTFTISKTSVTLPLSWGTFTALVKTGNQVQLDWNTLQEENTSYFDIQYSTDGRSYTSLGSVAAAGNSNSTRTYTFTHSTPSQSKSNFYRIRQVDLDGRSSVSLVRPVRFNNGKAVAVIAAPNPVEGTLNLSVQAENVRVTLSDMNGRTLRTLLLQPGVEQVNVSDLAPGIYHLSIYQNGAKIETQRILKK